MKLVCTHDFAEVPGRKPNSICRFSICLYSNSCVAFWSGKTWRQRLANLLRRWANKVERQTAITIVAFGPPDIINFSDVLDALGHGLNGTATEYLNQLVRERRLEIEFAKSGELAQPAVLFEDHHD